MQAGMRFRACKPSADRRSLLHAVAGHHTSPRVIRIQSLGRLRSGINVLQDEP